MDENPGAIIRKYFKILNNIRIPWLRLFLGYFLKILIVILLLAQVMICGYLIDKVILSKNMHLITLILGAAFVMVFLSAIISIFLSIYFGRTYITLNYQMRNFLLAHLRKIPINNIEKENPEKYALILGLDSSYMVDLLIYIVPELFSRACELILSFGILFFINWQIGLIGLFTVLFLIFIPARFKHLFKKVVLKVREYIEKIKSFLLECIEGSKEIKSLALENWEETNNKKLFDGYTHVHVLNSFYNTLVSELSLLVIMLVILSLYWMGAVYIIRGSLTVGMLVVAVGYLNFGLSQMRAANQFYGYIKTIETAVHRITDFLSVPEKNGRLQAVPLQDNPGSTGEPPAIEIRHLEVALDNHVILKNLNLTVKKEEKVAIIGRSGAGKSTLYKVLSGCLHDYQGQVFLEGKSLMEISGAELSTKVGIIFQEPYIFETTLYNNILIGSPGATEEAVLNASRMANLSKLINRLPQGLHTEIGNKGTTLSGGERQRITLARMFLKKPDILLLDEPMSSLDKENEEFLSLTLYELMKGKTILMSTHRVEMIREVDTIYIIDKGMIVHQGSHEELVIKSGIYNSFLMDKEEM